VIASSCVSASFVPRVHSENNEAKRYDDAGDPVMYSSSKDEVVTLSLECYG